ncbi:MAG: hypothetical protein F6J93_18725 [Oscillatoria sp. SIO1A7]|nr:hypothetical protein [Oscillatoria sp. SIO1A7]
MFFILSRSHFVRNLAIASELPGLVFLESYSVRYGLTAITPNLGRASSTKNIYIELYLTICAICVSLKNIFIYNIKSV